MATPYYVPYKGPAVTRAEAKATGLSRFFTNRACKHGHLSQRTTANGGCIACNDFTNYRNYHSDDPEKRARRAERHEQSNAWKVAHREIVRGWGREYSKAHRDEANAWKTANREKLNALEREARQLNRERFRERAVRYMTSPKGKAVYAAASHRRRARRANASGDHTAAELKTLFEKQKGKCAYCNVKLTKSYHADHTVALSKGGSNWISNIALSCQKCNNRKHAMDPIEFARRNGRLI